MARYVKDLVLNKPEDFVTFIMNDYLQKNQFVVSEWKGEPAYRTGDAMIEGYKYLKWSYENGTLHLEAWIIEINGDKKLIPNARIQNTSAIVAALELSTVFT